MPKINRSDGPSIAGGSPQRDALRLSGVDLEVGGPTAEILANSATIGTATIGTGNVTASTVGALAVTGASTFRTFPLAQYERLTFLGDQFRADPAFPATRGDTLNYPGWDFADAATQAVQWPFAPPKIADNVSLTDSFWLNFSVAVIWINLGAGSGNVRWQVEIRNLAIGIDLVTEAAAQTDAVNMSAAAQNVINAGVVTASYSTAPGFFSSEYSCRVSRIGADAGDTLTNAVRLGMVSFNRTA